MNPQQPGGQYVPPDPNHPYNGQPYGQPQPQPGAIPPGVAYQAPQLQTAPQPTYGPAADPNAQPNGQYEFILNPQKQKSARPSLFSGGSMVQRIIVVSVIALVLIIILGVVGSFMSSKSKAKYQPVIIVAQQQAELIRVAKIATTQANSSDVQNFAFNTVLSVQTAEQQTVQYLANNNLKLSPKVLALKTNVQTTKSLQDAQASSTFDTAFMDAIKPQLTAYINSLVSAYKANPGPKGQTLLNNDYKAAKLLQTQANQTNP